MSTSSLRLSLMLLVAGLVVGTSQSAMAVFPIDQCYAVHASVYDTWYANRIWLSEIPHSNEHEYTVRNGTRGSSMVFEKGQVYRIDSGPHAGATHFVNGGINEKYLQMGGPQGPAGFPIGDAYRISPTLGHRQQFQGGTIIWNVAQKKFVYYPYQFGDH